MIRELLHVQEHKIRVSDRRGLAIRKLMLKRLQTECDLMGLERIIASYEGILLQLKDLLSLDDGTM
jgi:hypothetical protein